MIELTQKQKLNQTINIGNDVSTRGDLSPLTTTPNLRSTIKTNFNQIRPNSQTLNSFKRKKNSVSK